MLSFRLYLLSDKDNCIGSCIFIVVARRMICLDYMFASFYFPNHCVPEINKLVRFADFRRIWNIACI